MGLSDSFRTNLRTFMDDRGMTILEVAKWSNMSESNLQRQLSGFSDFTLVTIEKVCDGLKIDPIAMLED